MASFTLMLGGCASGGQRATGPAPLHGYANLDALVRLHPGWVGIARYDEALARLAEAARREPLTAPSDTGLAALPPTPEGVPISPQLALQQGRHRLEGVELAQIARLRGRQTQNRNRQIALKRSVWEKDAAGEYARTVEKVHTVYAEQMRTLAADEDAGRLNLTLQIRALKKIISGWDKSTPPTPELNQARDDLQKKQDQLAALVTARSQSEAKALAERNAAVRLAAQVRDASVATLVAAEEGRLRSLDDRQAMSLEKQLAGQRDALLREERSLSFAAVPAAGALGAQNLASGPGLATIAPGAGHSFRLASAQLQAQRARWVAFLYSDTRAAALDAATQKHWVVTFGRPVLGERDLTASLAQTLTARVWKT